MGKIFATLLLIALFLTACNTEYIPLTPLAYDGPIIPQVIPQENPEEPTRPEPIDISEIPHIPRTVTSVTLTVVAGSTFATFDAKNINGANYFRFSDLEYTLEGTFLQEGRLAHVIDRAGETCFPISEYNYNNIVYLNLRELADFLNLRVAWIGSRNTIMITPNDVYATGTIFTAEPLPEHIINQITGVSFHDNAPFDYDHLAYLTITHIDFTGKSRIGNMIVAASIAEEVLDIFREIYEYGFPIANMRLIDYYAADDYYSMADNNSVGFNFRLIAGTDVLSRHAFGMAIDINPVQNPFIRGDVILPIEGANYLDRTHIRPGMIVPGDVVYRAFTSRGWTWGGHWSVPIDYHHFERR